MADTQDTEAFYDDAKGYWEKIPATMDGMLGGFSHISPTDIDGSVKFIKLFVSRSSLFYDHAWGYDVVLDT